MSTYLASYEPKHRTGPFTTFTATSKYKMKGSSAVASDALPRVTINGDPFFPTLTHLRMAIKRVSSCSYPIFLNTNTSLIEQGRRRTHNPGTNPELRPLTVDDFIIEAHLYTPHTIPIVNDAYAGKTTAAEALGL